MKVRERNETLLHLKELNEIIQEANKILNVDQTGLF